VPAGPQRLFTRDEDDGRCCCREWQGATAWQRPLATRSRPHLCDGATLSGQSHFGVTAHIRR